MRRRFASLAGTVPLLIGFFSFTPHSDAGACPAFEGPISANVSEPRELGQKALSGGRLDDAIIIVRHALAEAELFYGPEHALTLKTLIDFSSALAAAGRYNEAEALLDRAVDIETNYMCGGGPGEAAEALDGLHGPVGTPQ